MTLLNLLALSIPLTAVLRWFAPDQIVLLFFMSALGIIPASMYIEKATSALATKVGTTIGGFLNATFGNLPELFIGIATLRLGLHGLLKAQLIGGIIVNVLFVVGIAMLIGGLRFKMQSFNSMSARAYASLMLLATVALIMPSAYMAQAGAAMVWQLTTMSLVIACILFVTYILYLFFSLRTHRSLIDVAEEEEEDGQNRPTWQIVLFLAVSSVVAVWLSDVLIDSITIATASMHVNETFMGIIVLGTLGNVSGTVTAIKSARKNRMDLAFNVAIGSAVQQILFVIPVLVFASFFIGAHPMDLAFALGVSVTTLLAVIVMAFQLGDSNSHWLKGAQLLAYYAILVGTILIIK